MVFSFEPKKLRCILTKVTSRIKKKKARGSCSFHAQLDDGIDGEKFDEH